MSQLLDEDQPFGEKAARLIEDKLSLPRGWLDAPASATRAAPQRDASTNTPLAAALPVVLAALGELTPGQWRMVRARLDDMPDHPEMRDDVLADVLPLLRASSGKPRLTGT